MALITIIGRGHSGTRMLSHTLYASGVFMGNRLNTSGDKVPPDDLYEACRVMARHVRHAGGLQWDTAALHEMEIDPEFVCLVESYLRDVLDAKDEHKGWKLPETTLAFPWIARMFPDAKYLFLVRDARDCILGGHVTDDLRDFGVDYEFTDDERERRAISWKYQYDLVNSTPKPANFLTLRFEDFILAQERELGRMEEFLGMELARIVVRPETVGRWKSDAGRHDFDFFAPALAESGYPLGA